MAQIWVDITTIDNSTPITKVRWNKLHSYPNGDIMFSELPGLSVDGQPWFNVYGSAWGRASVHRFNQDSYSFTFLNQYIRGCDGEGNDIENYGCDGTQPPSPIYGVVTHDTYKDEPGFYDTTVEISGETFYEVDFSAWSGFTSLYVPYTGQCADAGSIYVLAGSSDITGDTEVLNFNWVGDNGNVNITAVDDWSVSTSENWVSISSLSGTSGTTAIGITADTNTSDSARTAVVSFTCNTDVFEVTVNQGGLVAITGTTSNIRFKTSGGTDTGLTITAADDWSASTQADWYTFSPTSGTSGNSVITITASANTGDSRNSNLVFDCSGSTYTVGVKQSGQFGGLYFGGLELENMAFGDQELEGLYLGELEIFAASKPKWYIEYTSQAKQGISPTIGNWGANLVSHEFSDGKGTMIFDGPYHVPGGIYGFRSANFSTVKLVGCTSINRKSGEWGALSNCISLTDVFIDNSCTSIADATFNDSTNITAITIGSGIQTLGNNVTVNSSNLATITIKATTPPTAGTNPFKGSASAGILYVPSSSVSAYESWIASQGDIAEWAVAPIGGQPEYSVECKMTTAVGEVKRVAYSIDSLTGVTIYVDGVEISPNGLLGQNVSWYFNEAGEHTVKYVFPTATATTITEETDIETYNASSNIKGIANFAISSCSRLTVVNIPKVTFIGNNALRYDSSLTAITMPRVESIGNNAFRGVGLEEVSFGPALTTCGYNLFNGSNGLTAMTFDSATTGLSLFQSVGDGVGVVELEFPDCIQTYCQNSMQYGLFYDAASLTAVTFGSGATTFQGLVFGGNMPSLTSITCKATTAPTILSGAFYAVTGNTGTLYVPQGSDYSTWAAELGSNWTVSDTL